MVERIFISYRRDDSAGHAGRVFDRLKADFQDSVLFMDVDAIPLGSNFVRVLREEVGRCSVLLAIIGPRWLDAVDEDGARRLDDANDFVRVEIAAALARDIPVIPILLEGARIPKAASLPADLQELPQRNALDVRHASFHADMDKLVKGLKAGAAKSAPAPTPSAAPPAAEPSSATPLADALDLPLLPDGTVGIMHTIEMPLVYQPKGLDKLLRQAREKASLAWTPSEDEAAQDSPSIANTDTKLGQFIRAQRLPPVLTADEAIAAKGRWVKEFGIDLTNAAIPDAFSHLFIRIQTRESSNRKTAGTILTGLGWTQTRRPRWTVIHGYCSLTSTCDATLNTVTYLGPTWRPEYAQLSDEVFKTLGGKPLERFITHP